MTICNYCLWECKEENMEACDDFTLSMEDDSILDADYLEYINDSYKDWQEAHGYHTDDEWFLDPQ